MILLFADTMMRTVLDPNQMRMLADLVAQPTPSRHSHPSNASLSSCGPLSAAASCRLDATAMGTFVNGRLMRTPTSGLACGPLSAAASGRLISTSANGSLACGSLGAAASGRLSASGSFLLSTFAEGLQPGGMGAANGLLGAAASSLPTSGLMLAGHSRSSISSSGSWVAGSGRDVTATVTLGLSGETSAVNAFCFLGS